MGVAVLLQLAVSLTFTQLVVPAVPSKPRVLVILDSSDSTEPVPFPYALGAIRDDTRGSNFEVALTRYIFNSKLSESEWADVWAGLLWPLLRNGEVVTARASSSTLPRGQNWCSQSDELLFALSTYLAPAESLAAAAFISTRHDPSGVGASAYRTRHDRAHEMIKASVGRAAMNAVVHPERERQYMETLIRRSVHCGNALLTLPRGCTDSCSL